MVIAHVIDSLEVGGAETVVAGCADARGRSHRVEVHCLMAAGRFAIELVNRKACVCPCTSRTARGNRFGNSFGRSGRLAPRHGHNKVATIRVRWLRD
jgi:hypothetical protein